MYRIFILGGFFLVIIILFMRDFNSIGQINAFTNPEKHKKVEIKNKIIKKLVPYKPQHFVILGDIRQPGYYERVIYKRTCVFVVLEYIFSFVIIVSFAITCVLVFMERAQEPLYKILSMSNIILMAFKGIFFGAYGDAMLYKYRKKDEKQGLDFKI